MIKIVAKMVVKQGKTEAFIKAAKELIEKSRAEEGNVFYTLNQSIKDTQTFVFIECWKDEEAIEVHNATEHFTGIVPKLGELCEGSEPAQLYREVE